MSTSSTDKDFQSEHYDDLLVADSEHFDHLAPVSDFRCIVWSADRRRATNLPSRNDSSLALPQTVYDAEFWNGPIFDNFISRIPPGSRVLEIGCGLGGLSLELARAGCHVIGMDAAEKRLKLAKKFAKENPYKNGFGSLEYIHSNFAEFEFDNSDKFDFVIASKVFHHIPPEPLKKMLAQMTEILNPSGKLMVYDEIDPSRIGVALHAAIRLMLTPHFSLFKLPALFRNSARDFLGALLPESLHEQILELYRNLRHLPEPEPLSPLEGATREDMLVYIGQFFNIEELEWSNHFEGKNLAFSIYDPETRIKVSEQLQKIDHWLGQINLTRGASFFMVAGRN